MITNNSETKMTNIVKDTLISLDILRKDSDIDGYKCIPDEVVELLNGSGFADMLQLGSKQSLQQAIDVLSKLKEIFNTYDHGLPVNLSLESSSPVVQTVTLDSGDRLTDFDILSIQDMMVNKEGKINLSALIINLNVCSKVMTVKCNQDNQELIQ